MEITTLDNVAIGIMMVLAFIALIYVVWNCAKIEKRQDKLEKSIDALQYEVNSLATGDPKVRIATKNDFLTPEEMFHYRKQYDKKYGTTTATDPDMEAYRVQYEKLYRHTGR